MKQTGKFCEYCVPQNHTVVISFVQNKGSRVITSYFKVIHALGQSNCNGKFLVLFCYNRETFRVVCCVKEQNALAGCRL